MTNPTIIDLLTTHYTANEIRSSLLLHTDIPADERANLIAALYYMEGTENND